VASYVYCTPPIGCCSIAIDEFLVAGVIVLYLNLVSTDVATIQNIPPRPFIISCNCFCIFFA
jgi:hypothetical protein